MSEIITKIPICKNVDGKLDIIELPVSKSLFLCQACFDGETNLRSFGEDKALHFSPKAAGLSWAGTEIITRDDTPPGYAPATVAKQGNMHFGLVNSPDGASFIPLFISYSALFGFYGRNIHIGVVTFDEIKELCIKDKHAGIILAFGDYNQIIFREDLHLYND